MLHQIGAGALGPVFRAYQPEEDRLVAVKQFRIDLPPERAHQLVVQLEHLIAADLTHAGIAAPIATGMVELSAYLAMDFVAADSLDIVIRDQALTAPSDVVRVASQLASALDLAASINITHGALHPRDVLISTDDVRMTGIGIARALEEVGFSAPIRRPYTAPERSSGARWDRRADVFSVAALIYELLTRRRISGPGDQPYDAFAAVAGASADALDKVFDRALAEQPGDRFATAGDFAKALQAAIERKRSVGGRVGPTIRPPAPEPVLERTPTAPVPVEELPLFTDSMLGSTEDAAATSGAPPPALVDFASEALGSDLSFREAPLSMVDSTHEPERSNGRDPVIDDSHSAAHDAGGPRLSLDDFTAAVDDRPRPSQQSVLADRYHDDLPREATKQPEPEFEINEVFAGRAAEDREPALRPGPFESASRPGPFESVESVPVATSSSSGVWPLMLALVVGIALGFGMAMLLLGRDRVPPAPQQASASPAPTTGSSATEVRDEPIREVTEQTVATPPNSQGQPASPAPAAATNVPVAPSPDTKPGPANPVETTPSPSAVDRTNARTAGPTAPTRPQSKAPVSAAKAPPTLPKTATALVKSGPNAKSSTSAAAKAAQTLPTGRGTAKPVIATPVKPASQTEAKTETGTLVVDSRPDGATIFLDGKRIGTTPLTLDVKVGQYTVGLDIPGYKRWASTVKINSGERSRLSASLEQ